MACEWSLCLDKCSKDEALLYSRRMTGPDFSGFSEVKRTDEIGILSDSLNELSVKLSQALSELQEANQKLQADVDRERQLERQRSEFFPRLHIN